MRTFTRDGVTLKVLEHYRQRSDTGVRETVLDTLLLLDIRPRDRAVEGQALFAEIAEKMKGKTADEWDEFNLGGCNAPESE